MKTLVLGGTDLTLKILHAMNAAGFKPDGVVSLPRSFSISYNQAAVNSRYAPIDEFCEANAVQHMVYEKDMEKLVGFAQSIKADFCLVAGWYFMLPKRFRDLFPLGCAGLHASMLPDLRGASPLNWALLKNYDKTGISLFQMTQGVDEGDLYAQMEFPIAARETIGTLVKKAEEAGVDIVLTVLKSLQAGKVELKKQTGQPTYSCPRIPEDSKIDWTKSADEIDLLIRASTKPYPGAFTIHDGEKLFIWDAEPYVASAIYGRPGQICMISSEDAPVIVCGDKALKVTNVTNDTGEDRIGTLKKMNYQTLGVAA